MVTTLYRWRLASVLALVILPVAARAQSAEGGGSPMPMPSTPEQLPLWAQQKSLWELAQDSVLQQALPPSDPQPTGTWGAGSALRLFNTELKVSLWGPPGQLTLSVNKTDVWDRRWFPEEPMTLAQLREACFAEDYPQHAFWNRSAYYLSYGAYDFPCPKPVGQLILLAPGLEGAEQPTATQRRSDGLTTVPLKSASASGTVEALTLMTRNLMLLRGSFSGLSGPLQVRLYRHQDTLPQGKSYSYAGGPEPQANPDYDYAKDAPANGPLAPPAAGSDGRYFWITQALPPEATFPQGFWYVFMATVVGGTQGIETAEGQTGLGTPPSTSPDLDKSEWRAILPWYDLIREAPGAAATARVEGEQALVLATVVTSAEAADPMSEARRLLRQAEADGWDQLLAENRGWWEALYHSREAGRIYYAQPGSNAGAAADVYGSWTYAHTGGTKPDLSQWEGDAAYAYMNHDWSPWHADNHFNEAEYTGWFVQNRADRLQMWYDIGDYTLPLARRNAREVYGCDGAMWGLTHVPIRSETLYHSNIIWEQGMEFAAQLARTYWARYDYAGDEEFLRKEAWPILQAGAEFYEDYVTLEDDGYYHVYPTVSQEHWGLTFQFEKNKDSISALSMIRWHLNTAARAAEILGLDLDRVARWREIAAQLAPYPTYETAEGLIYVDVRGAEPMEYNITVPVYPVLMTDEFNLDTPPEQREIMDWTARHTTGWYVDTAQLLLGLKSSTGVESLLNSRSGRAHFFPNTTEGVDLGFRQFLARGGFAVSAERVGGEVSPVFVTSRLGNDFRFASPWPQRQVAAWDLTVDESAPLRPDPQFGDGWLLPTVRGHQYRLSPQ